MAALISKINARVRARLACEGGWTLIELIWYIVLSLIVVVGPLYYMVTSIRQQNVVSSRAAATKQAETGLEQMVRDLRQAMSQDASGNALSVTVSNPSSSTTAVSFDIPTPGSDSTPQTITWTCPSTGASSAGSCTRQVGSGSAAAEITGVKSVTFTPSSSSGTSMSLPATNPAYLGISLQLQVTSQLDKTQTHVATGASNAVAVQTGVDLRNFG
jgi:type II secretory pathway pseudopilin PulG